ncbi:hypothetical protein [uncultured Cycloclasticus sp.]|jgi:hypothetical protein|uniref:hypothetical protein n=1 Tax=uncultured Cycloclasticus sp. TaxID=172194 RepID=UPI0025834074|nr:hypothetical protein [uncultured Cycloclasticus sp.]
MDVFKNNSNEQADQRELRNILIITALISLFLSLWQVLVDPIINSDGILYVSTAYHLQNGDWEAASRQYNWLFFPLIIAQLSNLTSLSLENSAYILNAFFTAITCTSFILIVKEFGGKDKATLWFASLIILCFPNLNEYRNMVIRDLGYWAFYLLSCYFFIKAYQHVRIKTIVPLLISSVLATLFRVEGLLFTLFLPVLAVMHQPFLKNKKRLVVQALTILLLTGPTYIFIYNQDTNGFSKPVQIERAIEKPFTEIEKSLTTTEGYLESLSPKGFSNDYAPTILGFVFILILFTEIFSAMSPFYAFMLMASLFKQNDFRENPLFKPWIYLILINLIILCGFLASRFFLAGRYPIPLALTLLIPLPFIIQIIYQRLQDKTLSLQRVRFIKLAAVLFVILSVDGLVSTGASKMYLKDAGQWIAANQSLQGSFFTNDQFISFYATGENKNRIREISYEKVLRKIEKGQLNKFNLLAIKVSRKNHARKSSLLKLMAIRPLKTFSNRKGDSVYIFRL